MAFAVASPVQARSRKQGRAIGVAASAMVAALVFTLSLGVRLVGLDLYSTADEGYWMQRSVRFGAALARGDLTSTYRAGHPGVSVMWTGLIGIGPARLAPFLPERFTRYELLERDPGYLEAFSAARRAVAILTSALVTLAVILAWRLLGFGPALAGGILLVLDPYVVGMTRLLHVDALLAPLMTVSALAGLIYWTRARRWGYLLLSAITGGLALLTKAPSGFLVIIFGLICLTAMLRGARQPGGYRTGLRMFTPLLIWGVTAAAVYGLLFPGLWTDPLGRIVTLIRFVLQVGLQPHDGNFFLGRPVLDDPGPLYYLVAVPLRLSPLVALGMGLLVLHRSADENRPAVRWLLLYVGLFAVLMTLASKKFDRYMLPAQMVLDLLAGVGLWRLLPLLARWLGHNAVRHAVVAPTMIVAMLIAVQVALLARVWPYPIAYYNPLAGGPERARQLIMVPRGEGLEQAAEFLNGLPSAESLYVVTNYNHVVRPRFVGTTIATTPYLEGSATPNPTAPDYIVLYVNARQRQQLSPEVARAESIGQPVFVAQVNGLPYAWVYRVPRTGPRPTELPPAVEDSESVEN